MSVSVDNFFAAVENRRSYYGISAESPISNAEIQAIVERSVKHAPNSFNMQQSRAIVLTGKHHKALWDMVIETFLATKTTEEEKQQAEGHIRHAFQAGYGTVVFFEDHAVLDEWSKKMPHFEKAFHLWSDNAAGILQYITWTALEAAGLGASLQHYGSYSPDTQNGINKLFGLPETWKSTAMMPFGKPTGPPGRGEKQFAPIEGERVKVFFE